ncbi:uncharacterized protein UTRI_02580 [Ustilago trichophora]|uniref:Uncharacterized protein n=1 Tax=Ustilago trichophora TaxID=86804 RepID=A0A5C3EN19_9BASI|nr:uncharacterized protein UTRI_02580 [Ustilago trichophora]
MKAIIAAVSAAAAVVAAAAGASAGPIEKRARIAQSFSPPSSSPLVQSSNYVGWNNASYPKHDVVTGKAFDRIIQIWLESNNTLPHTHTLIPDASRAGDSTSPSFSRRILRRRLSLPFPPLRQPPTLSTRTASTAAAYPSTASNSLKGLTPRDTLTDPKGPTCNPDPQTAPVCPHVETMSSPCLRPAHGSEGAPPGSAATPCPEDRPPA